MKKEKFTQLFRLTILTLLFVVGLLNVSLHAQQSCAITTTDFSVTSSTAVAIPTGPAVVSSTINVVGAGPLIADMTLQTFITHTFAADLDITLTSPLGTVVTLTTDNGAGNDNVFNGTLWDDDADPDGLVPYVTNTNLATDHPYVNLTVATPLAPEEPLAAFNGENPNGLWTLTISDDLAGDGGSLNSWTLNFKTAATIPVVTVTNHPSTGAVAIPTGPAVVTSSITVAGVQNYIRNLRVTTNLTHTFNADLDITLTSPSGTVVTLTTDNGAGNDNVFNGTLWDNDADPDGQVPFVTNVGSVTDHPYVNLVVATPLTPEESFGNFFTENPNGVWTLTISDDLGGDGGSLASWNIELSTLTNPLCNFTLPIAPLILSTSADVCAAQTTLTVPATTGFCTGVMYSFQIGNGPITPIMGTTFPVDLVPGDYVITYFATTPCGTSTGTQMVNVSDLVPPTLTCPADISISLDPGACNAVVNYTVTASDNCPFAGPAGQVNTLNAGGNAGNIGGMVYFNINNLTTGNITVTELGMNISAATLVNVYRKAGTHVGMETMMGTWTLVGSANATVGPFSGPFPGNGTITPAPTNFVLLPGLNAIGLQPLTAANNYTNGNGANQTYTDGTLTLTLGSASNFPFLAPIFTPRVFNGYVKYGVISTAGEIMLLSGLPSGSTFPMGITTNCFQVFDLEGNSSTCCFDVEVTEFATPTTTLACNDNVQVSVNEDCEAFVSTDMILEGGPYGCFDEYIVAIQGFGSGLGGVLLNSTAVGQTLTVTVTDPTTGNSCWGTISVEDKLPPTIECRDVTVMCGEEFPTVPAPELIGYQNILYSGLSDPITDFSTLEYAFDFSYLPPGTPALDVDARVSLVHTFFGDLQMEVESPSGEIQVLWAGTFGCAGFPINVIFDDEGISSIQCVDFDNENRVKPMIAAVPTPTLTGFEGDDASGIWLLRISDIAAIDVGTVFEVGLFINVNVPQADPADNCGEVDVTFTDEEIGEPCEDFSVIRHWVVTDESGNTATCDQTITVTPLVIDSVLCPPPFVGSCSQGDEDISPDVTGWPTVNGTEVTDESSVCNIFVGYWDKELNDCGEGVKIIRTWTILDWCTQETIECVQVIKVSDDEAPILTCPSNITVGTDFWYCYANVSVPKPTVFDECGSSWTLSMASSAGIIVNFGNNFVINQLGLGVHTVTWTATDECGNISTCTFTVTVVDDVAPIAICDEHTIVALTNDGPFGVTLVPAEVFDDGSYDACGPVTFTAFRMPEDNCPDFDYFDWTTNGACIDHIPGGVPPINSRDRGNVARPCVPFFCCDVGRGPIMVQLIVEDAAGNQNFCMVEIEVQDKISPFIECPPDITVSCDFWFAVEEGTFVDADGNNNGNLDEDPLSHVFGNMFDAFRYNDDESFREDIIINDPGALPFISPQPHFWGIDGWADDNCEVNLSVRVRVFDDCSGEDFPVTPPAGAVRLIERRFSASDGGVGIAPGTCTQRIWVIDYEPFFITDITCFNSNPNDGVIWPCDVILTTCPDNIGDLEGPIVFDDACSLIGVAFEDTRFNFVDGACFKILRKWSVIDWCQYNPLTGEGIWMYVQVIKVHDHDGPEFLDCPVGPVVLCVADTGVSLPANNQVFLGEGNPLASRCSAHLNLCKTVHETCSDFVDFDVKIWLHNGPSFIQVKPLTTVAVDTGTNNALLCFDTRESTIQAIRLNGIPYNSMWCGDYHRILWSVEDDCGNFSFCEYLFRLEDCKQPSPVCINGLSTVVMPVGGLVTIWAKDFDASSFDDCTSSDSLLFSFSGDSYQPSFTYNCDNVPAFGVELSVNIWVADNGTDDNCNGQISWNERNKDFCTTTIVITDNAGVCPDTIGPGSGSILGEIYTEDVESVEKVAVSLTSPGHVFPTYVTVEDGKYNFNNIILPADYEITSDRNDDHVNGVSTLDLVKIQKHLLGIEAMNSPYDLIAADANNSQNVSAIDLVELRKLILGVYTVLPNNESWRFVTKDFVFADLTHPWPFDEVIDITNMTSGVGSQDFVAVKIGDVNNTVQANALQILPRNGHGVVNFVADERTVNAGEIVDVTITSADFAGIEGYQFTMQTTGLEFRGIEGGAVSMNEENMGVFGSTLTASWHKIGGVSAGTSDILFTLQFQATAAGKLSQMIALNSRETKAEAYNTTSDIKDLKLTFRGAENGAEFALYQNEPNPFKGNTVIGYDLPEAGNVTLTIFDVTGKAVYVKEQNSVKGYNTIAISSKEMPSIGVLYYRLDANEYTATKKMIIIE